MELSILDLSTAIKAGEIERAKSIIAAGIDVNTPLDYDARVIMDGVVYGNLDLVKILVKAGADVSVWSEGSTAIMLAAYNAEREIYDYLYPLLDDYTRQYADKYGETKIRNTLIKREREAKKDIEQFIEDALFGNSEKVEKWIRKGINVNAIGSNGMTALMYAARQYHIPVVKLLLFDGNADPDIINYQKDDGEGEGKSALMYVVDSYHENNHYADIFELFKKAKANFNLQGIEGKTALIYAVENGYINAVQELINIKVNVDIEDDNNNTALMIAQSYFYTESHHQSTDHLGKPFNYRQNQYLKIINCLEKQGASQSGLENIALIDAAQRGDLEEVKRLISIGADVNHRCQSTALCRASHEKGKEIIKLLIEAGADVDKRSSEGHFNPLLDAAYAGHFEIVKILIEADANVNVRVEDYLNPLEYAELGFSETGDYDKRMRYLNIIELLENAGANRIYFD